VKDHAPYFKLKEIQDPISMKKLFLSLLIILFSPLAGVCHHSLQVQHIYYISPSGNDANNGLSPATAWRSIERVNRETFRPGDRILFESDGTWYGQLSPAGSGTREKKIFIGSYGNGKRPVINIGESTGAAITLIGQSWWEIDGLELTSGAPPRLRSRRNGITARAKEGGSIAGITVRECYIHDVWGQVGGAATSTMILISGADEEVLVENNIIRRCDKIGIHVIGKKNVVVRGNRLENLGGDGIIVFQADRGLIEHNIVENSCLRTGDPHLDTGDDNRYDWWPHTAAIWIAHCNETIMQFNEVYHTGRQAGNGDGQAFDFDFGCKNCILQYNYSRDNAGFLLIMDNTDRNIARYNISENEIKFRPTQLVTMFCDTTGQNIIHNNIFYVDHGTSDITYYYGDEYGPDKGKGKKDKGKLGAHFRNNIFYAAGQGRFRTVYALGDSLNSAEFRRLEDFHELPPPLPATRFYNNLYYGPWMNGLPDDPKAIQADPKLVSPGSGRYGLNSLEGYKLRDDSPCFNQAIAIEMEGEINDFYGNKTGKSPTEIGVFEDAKR
jgi:hypothetical protein